jgi:hypothetical protein
MGLLYVEGCIEAIALLSMKVKTLALIRWSFLHIFGRLQPKPYDTVKILLSELQRYQIFGSSPSSLNGYHALR